MAKLKDVVMCTGVCGREICKAVWVVTGQLCFTYRFFKPQNYGNK